MRYLYMFACALDKIYVTKYKVEKATKIINHYATSGGRNKTANAYNERKLCYSAGRQL